MPYVFISYNNIDGKYARKLADELIERGFNIWMDYRSLPYDERFVPAIAKAIRESSAFIIIMSPHSAASRWVDMEVHLALRDRKPIFPLLLDGQEFDILISQNYHNVGGGVLPSAEWYQGLASKCPPYTQRRGVDQTPNNLPEPTLPVEIAKPQPVAKLFVKGLFIGAGIGLVLAVLIMVGLLIFPTLDRGDITPTSQESQNSPPATSTDVAEVPTETPNLTDTPKPTVTDIPSITPTATSTTTIDPVTQVWVDFTLTADAVAAFVTATAAGWTYTPSATATITLIPSDTPNTTQTYEQLRLNAALTLTALSWTDTPMPTDTPTATFTLSNTPTDIPTTTFTPSSTPTVTFTPTNTQTATLTLTATFTPSNTPIPLGFPGNPVTRNVDWAPVIETIGGKEMALVPAGCFRMGNDRQGWYWDGNQWLRGVPDGGEQCFDQPFWIGLYEVTNAEYALFIEAGGYTHSDYWVEAGWNWRNLNDITQPSLWMDSNFNDGQQPVIGVSWYEVSAYVQWLSMETGLDFDLPTEGEWEYAARGPDAWVYPWGNDFIGENLNFCDLNCEHSYRDTSANDGYQNTALVGTYSNGASWVGALDMAGNAWEWASIHGPDYPYRAEIDNNYINNDSVLVLRGGSWGHDNDGTRASSRGSDSPTNRYDIGFRLYAPYTVP